MQKWRTGLSTLNFDLNIQSTKERILKKKQRLAPFVLHLVLYLQIFLPSKRKKQKPLKKANQGFLLAAFALLWRGSKFPTQPALSNSVLLLGVCKARSLQFAQQSRPAWVLPLRPAAHVPALSLATGVRPALPAFADGSVSILQAHLKILPLPFRPLLGIGSKHRYTDQRR